MRPIRLLNAAVVSQTCAQGVRRGEVGFGMQFVVELLAFVTPQGRIQELRIVAPSANKHLNDLAVHCIQRAAKVDVASGLATNGGEWQRLRWTWRGDP